ncbi:RHS repeat-associated core domain-containing protein [Agarilytica rhodophyticola]|uniref:RHS repeat-associated core domain-containing protein n=1 Tax=Agarilytica rhodophyticola TaxID=1737490 RepID=UPI001C1F634E|nr:RHS repeat-associated core domain-containing protein [Agarilytica rhodophyticola]
MTRIRTNNRLHRVLFTLLLWITTSVTATAAEVETLTFFHHDASGSVVAATNDAGEEIWRKNYRPYGEQQAGSNTSEPVSYTGHTHDNALGLTYMKNRYYDPHAGRFMGIDPVSVEDSVESNPQMFNRYAYGNNNPYRYVDPDGGNPKLVIDFALNVGLNYMTTGSLGFSTALLNTAKDAVNPLATLNKIHKLGKLAVAVQKVNKKIAAAKPAGKVAKKGTLPDEVFKSKAPKQTTPGTKTLEGQHINDKGRVEPWKAHYDEHGRQIGRTDYNAGNKTQGIPDTHHHTREYNAKFPVGRSTGDHIPGEYQP